jgi:hypothetical protein
MVCINSDEWYDNFVKAFGKAFEITELGNVKHILQMGVEWSQDEVHLSQRRHIEDLLKEYKMTDCKPAQTPMEDKLCLSKPETCATGIPYRSLLGKLLWIARCTRPDIYYAVSYLSRFTCSHTDEHFSHLKRILRYLKSTLHYKLRYTRQYITEGDIIPHMLEFYSDSDWASDWLDRKSVSGHVGFLFGNTLTWESRKQVTTALSSAESEYYALTDATKTLLHVSHLMREIMTVPPLIPMYMDNRGAQYMAENTINNKRTKHIDVRYRFVTQHVKDKKMVLNYVPTDQNTSDVFTKALGNVAFHKHSRTLLKFPIRKV